MINFSFRLVVNDVFTFGILVVTGAGTIAITAISKSANHFAALKLPHSTPWQV